MELVIDTNVFLNVKNREEPNYSSSKSLLDSIDDGRHTALLSTVVLSEIFCGYYLAREAADKEEFLLHVMSSENYKVVDVSIGIADEAARIRSETGLKLPDAIIAATGIIGKAKYLVTNDFDSFKKATKLITVCSSRELIAGTH